jgi:hypothetical protein
MSRQPSQRPTPDCLAPKALALLVGGWTYRLIVRELGLSKDTMATMLGRSRPAEGGGGVEMP